MNNKTIFAGVILWAFLILGSYCLVLQNKVNATEEIRQTQARISELKNLLSEAQENWQIAEESIVECTDSWNQVKDKAHNDAEQYRNEIEQLEGLLWQSQLQ